LTEYHKKDLKINGVWLQKGDSPYIYEHVPPFRNATLKQHWFKGNCVDAMGKDIIR